MLEIDRQPMILRHAQSVNSFHYYDEDVSRRETFSVSANGETLSIRFYVLKRYKRPTKWAVALILSTAIEDYWVGGCSFRNGVYNAYVRGRHGSALVYELKGNCTQQDALNALRWAVPRLYP